MARLLSVCGLALLCCAAPLFAANPTAGKGVFAAQCAICHGNTASSPPGIGPRLFGVVGRKSGTLKGYDYSPAMKAAGVLWTEDRLKTYIRSPQQNIPGVKMPYAGLKDEMQLDNLVAYLATLH